MYPLTPLESYCFTNRAPAPDAPSNPIANRERLQAQVTDTVTDLGIYPTPESPPFRPTTPCPRAQDYLLGTFPLFASRTAPRGGTVGLQIKSVVQRLQRGLRTPTCRTVGYV